jgi:tRNA U34 5-methylaminomethyl-2-thiouridine-forming methyltransferase MnmC
MGFGTGLNAILSLQWARAQKIFLEYTSFKYDPILQKEYSALNYGKNLNLSQELITLHEAMWNFQIKKIRGPRGKREMVRATRLL